MKFLSKLFLLTVCLSCLACAATSAKKGQFDTGTAWQKINQGALVIDVRSPSEYELMHVDGAINIPHTSIENTVSNMMVAKDYNIVLYCRSGRRASVALEKLKVEGYTNVMNAGGFQGLKESLYN